MKVKIEIEFTDTAVKQIITGIMENFPEASAGCALSCQSYKYASLVFEFYDIETNKRYTLKQADLEKAFKLMFTAQWPKGCTPPPATNDAAVWSDWLGQADATDFDAFVQLAIFDEVIYG